MKPLKSLRVMDLTRLLPGPWATRCLVELGAMVTRVVRPGEPDPMESLPPFDEEGRSVVAARMYAGKTKVAIDLGSPQGQSEFLERLSDADVLIEGFRPSVLSRLGLDPKRLLTRFPRLVICSITGYGDSEVYAEKAGHDVNYLALAGVLAHSGPGREPPPLMGIQVADLAGGSLHALMGLLSAVIHSRETGLGCHVQVSMTAASRELNALHWPGVLAGGPDPRAGQEWLTGGSNYGIYRTRDGRFLSVGALEPKFKKRLCEVLERPEWVPWAVSGTLEDASRLRDGLAALLATEDLDHWCRLFANEDCCVEPVLNLSETRGHPAFEDPDGNPVPAVRFSGL